MGGKSFGLVVALVLLLLLASNSLYIVSETERAVLLQFGEVVNPDVETGLHAKIPWVHRVRKFDARIITLDATPERFLTIEKKPLDVDFFAKWRVVDTQRFYTATNGEVDRAAALLLQRVKTGLRNQFGERTQHEVVSGERDLLMDQLTDQLNTIVQEEFGIEVVDVRVKRIELPERVEESVFARMQSEREREAREHRSTGREQAEVIRAAADRERTIILANAYRDSQQIRGEGDAAAAAIYADAFAQNAEFFAFVRSLEAYRKTFSDSSDLLVVDPDSAFFRYLKQSSGNR
ncbi:MAG: protease modulator HflC [Spongiibacteraceae bacterium]|jgi:membrane protease subunit HflC|nr:protease modulator HflC [Spongiibacteraceae bacterium]